MRQLLHTYWEPRTPREKRIIALGGGLLALALAYAYVWEPVTQERARLRASLPELRRAALEVSEQAAEVVRLKSVPASTRAPGQSLQSAIEDSATAAGLRERITQITQLDDARVQVTLNAVAFDAWIAWLKALLAEHNVRVDSSQISAGTEPGVVRVQAVLSAPR